MTEQLYLRDILKSNDRIKMNEFAEAVDKATPKKTSIIFKDHDTGEILGEEHNKVLITGSLLNACYAFGISSNYEDIPSYNKALNLDNSLDPSTEPDNDNIVCLFCVDDSGCGVTSTEVFEVSYTDRISPSSIMPFRYVDVDDDINYHNVKLVQPADLPEEYLPATDSYYEFEPIPSDDAVELMTYEVTIPYKERGRFESFLLKIGFPVSSLKKAVSRAAVF